jgi:hypothetical protein
MVQMVGIGEIVQLLIESVIVAAYCAALYIPFMLLATGLGHSKKDGRITLRTFLRWQDNNKIPFAVFLFVVGWAKHFVANRSGIHDLYCSQGAACVRLHHGLTNYVARRDPIYSTSCLEGLLFVVSGLMSRKQMPTLPVMFAVNGFMAHMLMEIIGVHRFFCTFCDNQLNVFRPSQ